MCAWALAAFDMGGDPDALVVSGLVKGSPESFPWLHKGPALECFAVVFLQQSYVYFSWQKVEGPLQEPGSCVFPKRMEGEGQRLDMFPSDQWDDLSTWIHQLFG